MPFTKSGWYLQSLLYSMNATAMTGTPAAIALTGQDANNKISLHSSSGTDYATELATGGATAATGSTSVTTTFAIGGAGPYYLQYSWTNPLAVASTTLTGVYGCILYANGITAPVAKPMLLLLCFGASYSTVSGVFGITPSGSGLSQITLTA